MLNVSLGWSFPLADSGTWGGVSLKRAAPRHKETDSGKVSSYAEVLITRQEKIAKMTKSRVANTHTQVKDFRAGIKPAQTCPLGNPYLYCLPNGFWYCCHGCASRKARESNAAQRAKTFSRDMYITYYRSLGVPVNELATELGVHRNTITNIFKRDANKLLDLWQTLRQAALRKLGRAAHIVRNAVWRAGKIRDAIMHNMHSIPQGGRGCGE